MRHIVNPLHVMELTSPIFGIWISTIMPEWHEYKDFSFTSTSERSCDALHYKTHSVPEKTPERSCASNKLSSDTIV